MTKTIKIILIVLVIGYIGYLLVIMSERSMLTQKHRRLKDDCVTNGYVYSVQTSKQGIDNLIQNNRLDEALNLNNELKEKYEYAPYNYFYYEYNLARIELKIRHLKNAKMHFIKFVNIDYCDKYKNCSNKSYKYCKNARSHSKKHIKQIEEMQERQGQIP